MTTLLRCKPGTRFKVNGLALTGTLRDINECSARVRYDDGQNTIIAPRTEVTVLGVPSAEDGPNPAPTVYGHPVAAVVRWCGNQAWSLLEVKAALAELGVKADCDLLAELEAGAGGAACAPLTGRQVLELENLL